MVSPIVQVREVLKYDEADEVRMHNSDAPAAADAPVVTVSVMEDAVENVELMLVTTETGEPEQSGADVSTNAAPSPDTSTKPVPAAITDCPEARAGIILGVSDVRLRVLNAPASK